MPDMMPMSAMTTASSATEYPDCVRRVRLLRHSVCRSMLFGLLCRLADAGQPVSGIGDSRINATWTARRAQLKGRLAAAASGAGISHSDVHLRPGSDGATAGSDPDAGPSGGGLTRGHVVAY